MARRYLPTITAAERIVDILVDICGWHISHTADATYFIKYVTEPNVVHEYRFCGALGMGGKFYISDAGFYGLGPWYVSCYPEDRTPEREAMINTANQMLRELAERVLVNGDNG